MVDTPILFLVFNRLETTIRVFEQIRKVQPCKLFIAADGPRKDNIDDEEKCAAVRDFVLNNIDWECEVYTQFRDENLGCGLGPATAITWFFESVEEGIILEDDCLPNLCFFFFCQELLKYYRDDDEIMHISGNNFQFGRKQGDASYYFSKYSHNWGWATWRRAWRFYNFNLVDQKDNNIGDLFEHSEEKEWWENTMKGLSLYQRNDVWDYQWQFTIWARRGLCILPNTNLVSNIGFNKDATHTYDKDHILSNIQTGDLTTLKHPYTKDINQKADWYSFGKVFNQKPPLIRTLKNTIQLRFPILYRKLKDMYQNN